MILEIDTTDNKRSLVKLGQVKIEKKYHRPQDQELLSLIDEILKKTNTSFDQITGIKVNPGPGSFTGTRVGVTVANCLAWILKIKVNNKDQVVAVYD